MTHYCMQENAVALLLQPFQSRKRKKDHAVCFCTRRPPALSRDKSEYHLTLNVRVRLKGVADHVLALEKFRGPKQGHVLARTLYLSSRMSSRRTIPQDGGNSGNILTSPEVTSFIGVQSSVYWYIAITMKARSHPFSADLFEAEKASGFDQPYASHAFGSSSDVDHQSAPRDFCSFAAFPQARDGAPYESFAECSDKLTFVVDASGRERAYAFSRPDADWMTEGEPVQNSMTFEESDMPFRRFPQHLIEIMRRTEQDPSNPAPLFGIFAIDDVLIAWTAIREQNETMLFLFSASPEKGEETLPAIHMEDEDIVAVCVVPPLNSDGCIHRIAIATACGVKLYPLVSSAASIEIDIRSVIFFPIPDVAVTSIVSSDTGRLFVGCSDGWVHELQYNNEASSWWQASRIRKQASLSLLPVPFFLREQKKRFSKWMGSWKGLLVSTDAPVVDMCVSSLCESINCDSIINGVSADTVHQPLSSLPKFFCGP